MPAVITEANVVVEPIQYPEIAAAFECVAIGAPRPVITWQVYDESAETFISVDNELDGTEIITEVRNNEVTSQFRMNEILACQYVQQITQLGLI